MKKHKLTLPEIKVMAEQIEADEQAMREAKKPAIKLFHETPFVKAVEEVMVKSLKAQPQQAVEQSIPFGDIEEDEEDNYALWVQEGHDEVTAELKSLRLERGIKQVEVARAIGVSPTKVCNFEAGKKVTHWDLMAKAYRMYLDKQETAKELKKTHNAKGQSVKYNEHLITKFIKHSIDNFVETTPQGDEEHLLDSLCSLGNHIDEKVVELEVKLFGSPCEEIEEKRTGTHEEVIEDITMIRIILQGINKDIDNCQQLSVHNSFIKSEPFKNDKACIALYQANYDPAQDDSEECPDLSKYTYNIFMFKDGVLAIFKDLTVSEARAVYKGEGLKFWTDK